MDSEFALIARLERAARRARRAAHGIVVDTGDDAAVLRPDAGRDLVATCDALIENTHFRRAWISARDLGARLAAVNLSDLAAMGAWPRHALVSFAIPSRVPASFLEVVQRAAAATLARYGAAIVGGNITSTDGPLALEMTLLGSCRRGRAWRRNARAGDAVVVAGVLGAAAAGLALVRERHTTGALVRAWRRPVPRLDVVRALETQTGIHGAIDVSDGFSSDLIHLCKAAGTGCEIDADALPIPASVRAFCRARGHDPVEWALGGGEDYALILAVRRANVAMVCRKIRRVGVEAAVVGYFTRRARAYRVAGADGSTRRLVARGWDHLEARR